MATTAKINFPVKTFDGSVLNEEVSLNLNIPDLYQSDEGFDKSNYLLYRALQKQLTNSRQGTRNTKTRAEVRGGGRKPWKQKGTGRARAGSNRSPLWKGGGVSFGPKPKTFTHKMNKKEWRLSLRLLLMKKRNAITVVNNFEINEVQTTAFAKMLSVLNQNETCKTVLIISQKDENLKRSSQNLKNVKVLLANCLNIKDIIDTKRILISKESLTIIEETYNA